MAVPPNRPTSIEFIVKPKQDLYLEGSLRRLPRVTAGENYPCQMQKTQNFSCLFRHYAKHNGLRKEDLVFTFVDELTADQTPETVHLMPQDEIWVEHRAPEPIDSGKLLAPTTTFSENFGSLLDTGRHSDVTLIVGDNKTAIQAHKAVLAARCEYFDAMFRVGGMSESTQKTVTFSHDATTFKRMLEFMYTDNVKDLDTCDASDILALMMMGNEFVLPSLKELCERFAAKLITTENVCKFLLLSSGHNASVLRNACAKFVQHNISTLNLDSLFRHDVENCPELGLLLFEASIPSQSSIYDNNGSSQERGGFEPNKRRRVTQDPNAEVEAENAVVPNNAPPSNTIAQANANVGQDY